MYYRGTISARRVRPASIPRGRHATNTRSCRKDRIKVLGRGGNPAWLPSIPSYSSEGNHAGLPLWHPSFTDFVHGTGIAQCECEGMSHDTDAGKGPEPGKDSGPGGERAHRGGTSGRGGAEQA